MADRTVHYEAAFEAFLRHRGVPYVAVDEAKKALFSNAKLKSFDFVVYSKNGPNLLIDVKGRQHRDKRRGSSTSAGTFQTWTTERDVDDLLQWEQVFGEGFRAILAFIYWVDAPVPSLATVMQRDGDGAEEPDESGEMFEHQGRWYRLLGVDLSEYRAHMRRRSVKWETVALPTAQFKALARPIVEWL
jgi:hypothetical protein